MAETNRKLPRTLRVPLKRKHRPIPSYRLLIYSVEFSFVKQLYTPDDDHSVMSFKQLNPDNLKIKTLVNFVEDFVTVQLFKLFT